MKRRSLFARLLAIYIVLLLPMLCTGLFIMSKSTRSIRENSLDNAELGLQILSGALETHLGDIQAQLIDYANARTSPVNAYIALSPDCAQSDIYLSLRKLSLAFAADLGASEYIEDITFYHMARELTFSTKLSVRAHDNAFCEGLLKQMRGAKSVLVQYEGELYVTLSYPFASRYTHNTAPAYMLAAKLSRARLLSLLSSGAYGECPTALMERGRAVVISGAKELEEYESSGRYAAIRVESQQLGLTLVRYLPNDEIFGVYSDLMLLSTVFVLISLPMFVLYALWVRRLVHRPAAELLSAFQSMNVGRLELRLPERAYTRDFESLYHGFNQMAERLETSIETVYKQELLGKEMERKQLQAQINPHFLYNAFFILKHQILNEDLSGAASMADYMSEYFRFITRSAQAEIPLIDEYNHAVSFLRIQRMRFREGLSANIGTIPPEAERAQVPKLILQPLLENAFAHARNAGDSALTVSMTCALKDGAIEISVEDNGDRLTDEAMAAISASLSDKATEETTALINIHRRLTFMYGAGFGLTLARSALGGLKMLLRLPMR